MRAKREADMAGAKGKYIEAAYELLERDGLEGVSIRKVAEEVGCSSTALYRHFPDIDKLITVASIRFLSDYAEDARTLSQVEMNPLELNLQLWECLAFYSFQNADVFENLFYGDQTGTLYSEAVSEYFTHYPEDLMGLKDFMFDMLMFSTIEERDAILLERAEEQGMLSKKGAAYLLKIDSYLFRGMLADLRGRVLSEEDFRKATHEFMQLLIRSYMTQIEDGFSILAVNPDFVTPQTNSEEDAWSSYRVRIVPANNGNARRRGHDHQLKRRAASAKIGA